MPDMVVTTLLGLVVYCASIVARVRCALPLDGGYGLSWRRFGIECLDNPFQRLAIGFVPVCSTL